jgi:hypothetical protein
MLVHRVNRRHRPVESGENLLDVLNVGVGLDDQGLKSRQGREISRSTSVLAVGPPQPPILCYICCGVKLAIPAWASQRFWAQCRVL